MKVLLTGANGQLGHCFQDRVPENWQIMATDSNSLDITNFHQIKKTVEQFHPDLIVNAAAYTAVDKAEIEIELARYINTKGPENLAIAAKSIDACFVHVSTDYVFDGISSTPYKESDLTHPLSVYGATKLAGELAVQNVDPKALIIRTAWVFSEYGNNFVKTILRLAREKDSLSIVEDQRGCPTYAGDIAAAIIKLYQGNAEGGIYHFCGDKEVSWKEFTEHIVAEAYAMNLIKKRPSIKGISTAEYPTAAHRPFYSTLSCQKISRYHIGPSDWMSAINYCMKKYLI
jgi:dTDP-4-dehydrorhamnose reductase